VAFDPEVVAHFDTDIDEEFLRIINNPVFTPEPATPTCRLQHAKKHFSGCRKCPRLILLQASVPAFPRGDRRIGSIRCTRKPNLFGVIEG
jgi:hypothetical protein